MFVDPNPYHLQKTMAMNAVCTVCGQPLDIEPGFYYGTNMVSYALAVCFSALSFFLWWATIGFSLQDARFFWWMGLNAALLAFLQPPLMRISRALWLAIFVPYARNWKTEALTAQL